MPRRSQYRPRSELEKKVAEDRTACGSGDGPACFGLGFLSASTIIGQRGEIPDERAESFYERGCAAGDARSCYALGAPLLREDCPDLDRGRGMPLVERACALGEPMACTNLAALYETGYGVPPDPARAAQLRRARKD